MKRCNSDPRCGLEFYYNKEASLDRGARLLKDFNAFRITNNLLIFADRSR